MSVFENNHPKNTPDYKTEDLGQYMNTQEYSPRSHQRFEYGEQLDAIQENLTDLSSINLINNDRESNQNQAITELQSEEKRNYGARLLQRIQKGISEAFVNKEELAKQEAQVLHNQLIEGILEHITISIDGESIDLREPSDNPSVKKIKQNIAKTVSDYARTLYNRQIETGLIQKGEPYDFDKIIVKNSNQTPSLSPNQNDSENSIPGFKVISFDDAIKQQINLFNKFFKQDVDPNHKGQVFLEVDQDFRIKTSKEINDEREERQKALQEAASSQDETSSDTQEQPTQPVESYDNLSEKTYSSINRMVNFLYNTIDDIDEKPKVDKVLQNAKFRISAELVNIEDDSAFDYIQEKVIQAIDKVRDVNKVSPISPQNLSNYLQLYANKLEKIQNPAIRAQRNEAKRNSEAIRINEVISLAKEQLLDIKNDLKNQTINNTEVVEKLEILRTEFDYMVKDTPSSKNIFAKYNQKIDRMIKNGSTTSPTLLSADLSAAYNLLNKAKQPVKEAPKQPKETIASTATPEADIVDLGEAKLEQPVEKPSEPTNTTEKDLYEDLSDIFDFGTDVSNESLENDYTEGLSDTFEDIFDFGETSEISTSTHEAPVLPNSSETENTTETLIKGNITLINSAFVTNNVIKALYDNEIEFKFNIIANNINPELNATLEKQVLEDMDTFASSYDLSTMVKDEKYWLPEEKARVVKAFEALSDKYLPESNNEAVQDEITKRIKDLEAQAQIELNQTKSIANAENTLTTEYDGDDTIKQITESFGIAMSAMEQEFTTIQELIDTRKLEEAEEKLKQLEAKRSQLLQDSLDRIKQREEDIKDFLNSKDKDQPESSEPPKREGPKIIKRSDLAKIPGKLENFKTEMEAAQQRLAAKGIDINIDELEGSIASTHSFLMGKNVLLDSGDYRKEYFLIDKFQDIARENNYSMEERYGKFYINKDEYMELQLIDMHNYAESQKNKPEPPIIKKANKPKPSSTNSLFNLANPASNPNTTIPEFAIVDDYGVEIGAEDTEDVYDDEYDDEWE